MTAPRMLLVDGSSYLYRAHHAAPDLRTPEGFPTGALHIMVGMMNKLRTDYPAAHAVCVFDAPGRTFRDDWYAEYKANRSAMPDALAQQIAPIHEVVRLLGWPVLEIPGIEADDAIGTLARVAVQQGHEVLISTGDKDLAQLVGEHVTLVNTMMRPPEVLDVAGVQAKFGVAPSAIVDYLTLIGDAIDNVPGVDKVGPKTAAKWLADHGSLEGVIAAAPAIKGVAGENLRQALAWLPTGRKLVTVHCDCDLGPHVAGWPSLDALALREVDRAGLLDFYQRYGFKAWRRELEESMGIAASGAAAGEFPRTGAGAGSGAGAGAATLPGAPTAPRFAPPLAGPCEVETISDRTRLRAWIERLRGSAVAALAAIGDSADGMRARLVGLSLATEPGRAAYVPLAHDAAGAPAQLGTAEVLAALRPWLEDDNAVKVGHGIKADLHVLANHGIALRGMRHDTMLQSYVLEAHRAHTLESLAERHLGRKCLLWEEVVGKGASQIAFGQLEPTRAAEYAGQRAEVALHVHAALWPQIEAAPPLREIYERFEMPVAHVLHKIERHGVLIDAALLARQSRDLAERLVALEREAYAIAGQPFNLGSPKQIGDVLFGRLALPVKKRTASGAPSTDEDVLQELAADYPLPARILEHRGLAKLKGTYTDKLPLMVDPDTGRVHTNYAQAVAVTGRLSSNDPNLQNIPIRTAEGRRIREAFVAPPGSVIVSADYSQIELRLMAHISEDPGLLRAFSEGVDIHRATASEVFGVPLDEVSSEQRRYAKVINFGLIYGMSAFGLAQNLGIEQKAARDYIGRYFQRFALVRRYMETTKALARERGYVETAFGRRLWLPEINSGNGPRRSGAERQAINAPMQGTAADLVKLAMVAVQDALEREGKATKMILQVHDELVFEVPATELEWARAEVPRLMAGVAQLKVPLVAEVGVGRNWDEAH